MPPTSPVRCASYWRVPITSPASSCRWTGGGRSWGDGGCSIHQSLVLVLLLVLMLERQSVTSTSRSTSTSENQSQMPKYLRLLLSRVRRRSRGERRRQRVAQLLQDVLLPHVD